MSGCLLSRAHLRLLVRVDEKRLASRFHDAAATHTIVVTVLEGVNWFFSPLLPGIEKCIFV